MESIRAHKSIRARNATAPERGRIADIGGCLRCAITGCERSQQKARALLNHLVGGYEQVGRHSQAECLCCFEVDDHFELGRRLYRKVGRFVAA